MKNTTETRIGWVDLLRVLACLLVVLSHCCDPFVAQFDNNRTEFLTGVFWGSLVRSCVPLFVMMTGVLLLPLKMDMGTFYRKRIKRVVIPLVIWSLITPVLYYLYLNHAVETTSPSIAMADHTLTAALQKLYLFVFNFSYATTPLWYLYMLIGLYLFMPIIGTWLNHASQKDIKCFLYIWGISMMLPCIQMLAPITGYAGNFGNQGLLGVCDWNPYGTFYYFSGFIGYIVLAYYLVKYPLDWSWKKIMPVTLPLFLVGYIITAFGFIFTQNYYPGNFAYLELLWYFSGINVFAMTFSIFVIMQKLQAPYSPFMSKVASFTFGIYLCHFLIVQMGYDLVHTFIPLPAFLQIPLMAILVFSASLAIVWLLSLNRITRKAVL